MNYKHSLICIYLLSVTFYSSILFADSNIDIEAEIIVIKSPQEIQSKQKLRQFIGISAETAKAKGLSMNLVVIPPGGQAKGGREGGEPSSQRHNQGVGRAACSWLASGRGA